MARGPIHALIVERGDGEFAECRIAKSLCGMVVATKHDLAEKWVVGRNRVLRFEKRDAFKGWDQSCRTCEKKYADMAVVDALMGDGL